MKHVCLNISLKVILRLSRVQCHATAPSTLQKHNGKARREGTWALLANPFDRSQCGRADITQHLEQRSPEQIQGM